MTTASEETKKILKEVVKLYNMQNFDDAAHLTLWRKEKLKEFFDRVGTVQLRILGIRENAFVRIAKVFMGSTSSFFKGYLLLYKCPEGWLVGNFSRNYRKTLECTRKWSPNAIEKLRAYVKSNHCKDLSFLSTIAEEKSIILLGETHYAEQIYTAMGFLTRALHQLGYTNIIMEKPSSLGYYCSKYLQTGDKYYYRYTLDEGSFLKSLWEYSQDIPQNEQFNIWCIDIELVPWFVFIRLDDFLQRLSPLFPVRPVQEKLSLWAGNVDILPEVLKNINKLIKDKESSIPDEMSAEYVKICEWINELETLFEQKISREETIKRRAAKIYADLSTNVQNPKIIGIFGADHVAKLRLYSKLPENLGEFLSQTCSQTKGKVYSLRLLPYQGEIYTSIDNNEKIRIWPTKYSIEDISASTMEDDFLFIDLEPLKDYWFYDNMMNWINYQYYDGILLSRDVTCATRMNY